MRYTQLRAFDAVARSGGFSAAAERIGLTQPAVTIQVRSLEEEYRVKLFDRRRGGETALTERGRALFGLTRELFAVEERISEFLDESRELRGGEFRLSTDGPYPSIDLIAAFGRRHPRVRLAVTMGNAHTVWRDLLEGRADAVLVANPPDDSRTTGSAVCRRRLVVVIPGGHHWAGKEAVAIADLKGQPVVMREPQSNTRRTLERALAAKRITAEPVLELGSREAVIGAVAAGLGLGFAFEGEVSGQRGVVAVAIDNTGCDTVDWAVCLRADRERAAVAAFFDVAAAWKAERT